MKRNVAIIIPELTNGGAERVASNLSLNISEDKFNKYIIVYNSEKTLYPYGGKLININTKATPNPIGKIINLIKRFFKLKQIKRQYNIHTTISLLANPNIMNIFTKTNDKVIVSVRNFVSKANKGFYGRVYNASIKFLYNKADKVVVVSRAIKNDLIMNFGLDQTKIKVIYNFYDIERINELAKEEIEEQYKDIFKNPTIITVGRLSQQKGQWHLIRAFKEIKQEISNAKLVILGQGELKNYLRQLAMDLGLGNDIYFLGFQENPFKYIARSTIYVLPSLYEGFPNALCEAMACRIPVVSSDCKSGPREILAPGTDIDLEAQNIEYEKYGILVPVCNGIMYKHDDKLTREERFLSKSIIDLLSNKELLEKYSTRAFRRSEDFCKENIIKIWENEI